MNRDIKRRSRGSSTDIEIQLDSNCDCKSAKTGKVHNFCYIDPQNITSVGRKFDCSNLEHLENLGIFDFTQKLVDTSKSTRPTEDVVFVSATSDDHFRATLISFGSIHEFYPDHKYILYNLGLSPKYRAKLVTYKNVEVRDFDFSKFPSYTKNVLEYRWKVLFISEVLKEYPNIWWIDAHLRIVKGDFANIVYKERAEKKVESDIVLPCYTSHSNFAVMIPAVYNHIPTNSIDLLKSQEFGLQFGANLIYIARTRQTLDIFKWFLLCALDETCMNPPTAQLTCKFGANMFDYFADCFRFDQSIINLLLLNKFQDYHKYVSSVGGHVDRFKF